jgi:hypothetical protein
VASSSASRGGEERRCVDGGRVVLLFSAGRGGEGAAECFSASSSSSGCWCCLCHDGLLPPAGFSYLGGGSVSRSRRPVATVHERSSSPVIIDGLRPVLSPDQKAVGLSLRRCIAMCVSASLRCVPSGVSPAAPLQAGTGARHRFGGGRTKDWIAFPCFCQGPLHNFLGPWCNFSFLLGLFVISADLMQPLSGALHPYTVKKTV